MPVSLNQGFRMPSWFDLFTLDESGPEDECGIKEAAKLVHSLIDREIESSKIPSSRIALGGFSQGGALALYSAFTYNKPLAGVMALSCWIPLYKSFPAVRNIICIVSISVYLTDLYIIGSYWKQRYADNSVSWRL